MTEIEYYTWDNWKLCDKYKIDYIRKNNIRKVSTSYDKSKDMVRVEIVYNDGNED